jgi:DNA-binding MarR family transcriptional regulator
MPGPKRSQSRIGPAQAGFELEDYVLYNLVRTAATYNEEMAKALRRYGLHTIEWRVLMLLNDKSPSAVGELARRSVAKMPTLTRVLIRMENNGLVVRRASSGDKRFVQVSLTPKAVKTLKVVQVIGQRVFERALENIDGAEAAALTSVLKRIRINLGKSPYEVSDASQTSVRAS